MDKPPKKCHLIWEKEKRARKRAAKQAQLGLYAYASSTNYTGTDWTSFKSVRIYAENRKPKGKQSQLGKFSYESKVPMLSDHLKSGSGAKVS